MAERASRAAPRRTKDNRRGLKWLIATVALGWTLGGWAGIARSDMVVAASSPPAAAALPSAAAAPAAPRPRKPITTTQSSR